MTSKELRKKFLKYFANKDHQIISSASLIPENDSTVLFTTAGMQPLIPYLKGTPHPRGKRLVNVQKCWRTNDIEEVGDKTHHTFFEMLGNWSLGDYWKKEAIEYSWEFLIDILKLDKANVLYSYDEKYHIYDHEFGAYIYDNKQRKRRGVLYATIIAFVFIATHYMAINYVEDNESAGFYPPYIEKQVVYPELYKEKKQ